MAICILFKKIKSNLQNKMINILLIALLQFNYPLLQLLIFLLINKQINNLTKILYNLKIFYKDHCFFKITNCFVL